MGTLIRSECELNYSHAFIERYGETQRVPPGRANGARVLPQHRLNRALP